MANAHVPTAPGLPGNIGSPASRRSPFATRRRILVLVLVLAVVGIAALANYGPLRSYREARSRYDSAVAEVEALTQKKAELQSQLGKLTEADYLESLARQELTYARPGEDVYIITDSAEEGTDAAGVANGEGESLEGADGAGAADGTSPATSEPTDEPGLLERALSAFLGLF
jgi:cell division protein FtsB